MGFPSDLSVFLADNVGKGMFDQNILSANASVADGDTVTIGDDVYEFNVVTQDSGDDTQGGDFNNTTENLQVEMTLAEYPNLSPVSGTDPLIVGDVIGIGSEFMRVASIGGADGVTVTFKRGWSGTTVAAHADAANILEAASLATAGRIPVALTATVTQAAFVPALVATINDATTEAVQAVDLGLTTGAIETMLLMATSPGANGLATTETFTNANIDFATATMQGGDANGAPKISVSSRSPDATEVTSDVMAFALPFDPDIVFVDIIDTNSDRKAWDGALTTVNASGDVPAYVTIDNSGTTDWAATDTVRILAVANN